MSLLALIDEAQKAGARLQFCCKELGLDPRTVQRWREEGVGDDGRHGPKTAPSNKLTTAERAKVIEVANSAEYRNKSPKQIVPALADKGVYVASESTFFRVLREEEQLTHRGHANPPTSHPPAELRATGPNQVWSWDITYLRSPIAGSFFYLYLFLDVWSRKIVGFEVEASESSELASGLLERTCALQNLTARNLAIHSDNGSPMKGATLRATMERLGVVPSFSRPRVSDDNPFSEAAFRTLKYRPSFPRKPFESIEAARAWVADFVVWYNHEHLHSGIGFVTPASRHDGSAAEILERRRRVYAAARKRHPERWSRTERRWEAPTEVILNPSAETKLNLFQQSVAA